KLGSQSAGALTYTRATAMGLFDTQFVEPEPDTQPDFYSLQIRNENPLSEGIRVSFVCVHTDNISLPPPPCYFDDPQFKYNDDYWTPSGDVEYFRPVDMATIGG